MISCVYCGGAHERPAEVKQCWADHQGTPAEPALAAAEPALDTVPEPASAPRRAASTGRARSGVDPSTATAAVHARRGPRMLGRHVVVGAGDETPSEWADADRVRIDRAVLAAPTDMVDALQAAADTRTGLVIELAVEFAEPPGETTRRAPWEVGVDHRFLLERLHHLVWSNTIDLRDDEHPRWALVDAAVTVGARVGGFADVVGADGTDLWLDGGPVRHHDPIDETPVVHAVAVEHGSLTPPDANVTTADLAPDQLAAVTHGTGAARIIAPAGSGKTRVLTERARHLVGRWRLPASAVCLVAFNKRAQEEMRERTSDLPGLQVRTLNSIALAVVNGTAPFAPQPRTWRTIDEPDVRRLLGRFVSVARRRNTDPIAPWIEALSLVRLGLVDPVEAEGSYGGDVDGLAEVVPRYLAALEHDGAVDFDGQIDRAIRVLLSDPAARTAAQRACRVLLVDEFQDLTPAHLLLVRLLAGPHGAVFGVGDDDQTIYGYNGADPAWLIEFADRFPGAGDHPLEVNYRCPSGVVDVADRLLRHNVRRVAKTIRAAADAPADGWSVAGGDDEVAGTVDAVTGAIAAGAPPAHVAVLTRVNAVLAPVQVALLDAGVPVASGVGGEFMERTAIRAALAWLRLASGRPFAPDDLQEALRRPSRALHPRIGDWVGEQRDVAALGRLADRVTNERDSARIREFASDIERLQALLEGGATTRLVVDALIDEVGLGGAVATLDDKRRGMNRGSQSDDLLALAQLAALQPDPALFEGWLRDRLLARRSADGITLATVHRVKGQEWPVVVVHQATDDQFPHRLSDDHEEERRLFHVAITRASQHVIIVPGGHPSPFVDELTTEPPDRAELARQAERRRAAQVAARATAKQRDAPDHPLLDRDRVMAVEGTVLVDQGQEWTIFELEPEAAVARRGEAIRRFPLGSKVETVGRQRGELGPRPGGVEAASALAFDLLRRFRDRARDGKPAYTVFDDKTLVAIAVSLPASLDELARVKGIGPAKLDQYGDSVLTLLDDARALSVTPE